LTPVKAICYPHQLRAKRKVPCHVETIKGT
jgi:hypothetical protein